MAKLKLLYPFSVAIDIHRLNRRSLSRKRGRRCKQVELTTHHTLSYGLSIQSPFLGAYLRCITALPSDLVFYVACFKLLF